MITEAAKLSSYMHFREPFRLQKKTLLEKADLDKAIDFMDVIEEDVPKGNTCILKLILMDKSSDKDM